MVLNSLKDMFGDEGNPNHGGVGDGVQHKFFQKTISPFLILSFL